MVVFEVVRKIFEIEPYSNDLDGYCVNLHSVIIWIVREILLMNPGIVLDTLELNLKIDGRPFYGKYENCKVKLCIHRS